MIVNENTIVCTNCQNNDILYTCSSVVMWGDMSTDTKCKYNGQTINYVYVTETLIVLAKIYSFWRISLTKLFY